MIWQQPWAWLGLLAVAAPIIIHLLGLGRSPTRRFPTLRFFDISRLAPTRRTQLHDPWLLLLRVAILVAAVSALAQPFYASGAREQAYASSLARVVVLDTSASVQRAGANALDSARRLAAELVAEADIGMVLESAAPGHALAGGDAWLAMQAQRGELVVLSDFQVGAVDTALLRRISAPTGIRLLRLAHTPLPFPITTEYRSGDRAVRAVTSRTDSGPSNTTQVLWSAGAQTDAPAPESVRVLSASAEDTAVRLANEASFAIGPQLVALQDAAIARDSARRVTIVTPASPRRASVLATARVPREAWMLRAVASLHADRVLQDIASETTHAPTADSVAGLVVAYTDDQRAAIWAAEAEIDGRVTLLLVLNVPAESLTMPALLAAARAATAAPLTLAELQTERLADSVLAQFERTPAAELRRAGVAAAVRGPAASQSDGRWVWLLVLLLLGAEFIVRRRMQARHAEAVSA